MLLPSGVMCMISIFDPNSNFDHPFESVDLGNYHIDTDGEYCIVLSRENAERYHKHLKCKIYVRKQKKEIMRTNLTYEQWKADGFYVRKGEKSSGRNECGVATFSDEQVEATDDFGEERICSQELRAVNF